MPPSGINVRIISRNYPTKPLNGIPVSVNKKKIISMPEPVDGVMYIASSMVRHAHPERKDVASPDLVMDENRILSCRGLVVNNVKSKES